MAKTTRQRKLNGSETLPIAKQTQFLKSLCTIFDLPFEIAEYQEEIAADQRCDPDFFRSKLLKLFVSIHNAVAAQGFFSRLSEGLKPTKSNIAFLKKLNRDCLNVHDSIQIVPLYFLKNFADAPASLTVTAEALRNLQDLLEISISHERRPISQRATDKYKATLRSDLIDIFFQFRNQDWTSFDFENACIDTLDLISRDFNVPFPSKGKKVKGVYKGRLQMQVSKDIKKRHFKETF